MNSDNLILASGPLEGSPCAMKSGRPLWDCSFSHSAWKPAANTCRLSRVLCENETPQLSVESGRSSKQSRLL